VGTKNQPNPLLAEQATLFIINPESLTHLTRRHIDKRFDQLAFPAILVITRHTFPVLLYIT